MPRLPSTMTMSPPETSVTNLPSPTTAGILQDAGDDGGMTGPAAGLGGEAVDVRRVQRRRFARRQVVGQDDDGFAEVLQVLAPLTEQDAEQTLFEVEQVGDPAGEVAAFEALRAPWRGGASPG